MREVTIPPNWKYILQLISQSGVLDNIYLKDTWFTPDLEENPRNPPSQKPSVDPENNNKMLPLPQYEPHVQKITDSKGASAYGVRERKDSEGF